MPRVDPKLAVRVRLVVVHVEAERVERRRVLRTRVDVIEDGVDVGLGGGELDSRLEGRIAGGTIGFGTSDEMVEG